MIQLSTTMHCYDLRQAQLSPRLQALRGVLLLPNNNMHINSKIRNVEVMLCSSIVQEASSSSLLSSLQCTFERLSVKLGYAHAHSPYCLSLPVFLEALGGLAFPENRRKFVFNPWLYKHLFSYNCNKKKSPKTLYMRYSQQGPGALVVREARAFLEDPNNMEG